MIGALQESVTAPTSARDSLLIQKLLHILKTASRFAMKTHYARGTLLKKLMTTVSSTKIAQFRMAVRHVQPDPNTAQEDTTG